MAAKLAKKSGKITTVKLAIETKERLDHFREYRRESYEEILERILHILNLARSNPEAAAAVLRNIDLKLRRKRQVYPRIPEEKQEVREKTAEKVPAKPELQKRFADKFRVK